MIEFITLLLGGLVTGPRTIEVMVSEPAVMVELRLDGEIAGHLESPPWRLEVDFGGELSPHLLEAAALDASGRELARARQWINMAPEAAHGSVVIDGADRGTAAVARVRWKSLAEAGEPISVTAHFDGEPLTVDDPRTIQLPPFDPDLSHHLSVRLEFTKGLFSETEAVFGGAYGDEVSTEISAVPIRIGKGVQLPPATSMKRWFTVDGVPSKVHAVERGLAEIVVLRDESARTHLQKLASRAARLDLDVRLKKDMRVSFISPCPRALERDDVRQLVYPHTQRLSSRDGSFLQLLARIVPADCSVREQQLTDALAIAGLAASADDLRRIVVLILGDRPRDRSEFTPAQVVAYLDRLHVPLEIWRVGPAGDPLSPWGPVTQVRSLRRLDKSYKALRKGLDRQRIIWLDGLHLPQSVTLRPGLEGLSLVKSFSSAAHDSER